MTDYSRKLVLYANGSIDSKQDIKIKKDDLGQIIAKKFGDSFKLNIYSIRFLLYTYLNQLFDKKNLLKSQKSQLFIWDNITINNTVSIKFKQNIHLIFECINSDGIKLLLFILNDNSDSDGEIDEISNKFFYHNCLKITDTKKSLDKDDTYGKLLIKHLEFLKSSKKIFIQEDNHIKKDDDSDDIEDHEKRQEYEKLIIEKINKNKIDITIIKRDYSEYNIDKKIFDFYKKPRLILTEYYDGNYYDYLQETNEYNDESIYNSLIQIFISLIYFYSKSDNKKYIIKPENIFYKSLNPEIQESFLYKINKKQYILKNLGHLFVIFNYDLELNDNFDSNVYSSFLNILQNGIYKRYLYNGYNDLIVQLIQEIISINHEIKYSTILNIFNLNVKSFREIYND